MELAERFGPDAVVLSASLPQGSASGIYRQLKASPRLCHVPVISYSLQVQMTERPATSLYTSPQHRQTVLGELASRATAALTRSQPELPPSPAADLVAGPLVLHARNLTVDIGDRTEHLTRTEFDLLRYLTLHLDEACPSRRLLQQVWGYPPGTGSTDVVRTHIRNLRLKIEECPTEPTILRTVHNCGYMLCSDGQREAQDAPSEPDHTELPSYSPQPVAVSAAPAS
jgi:DNA-binding response OmpR family regulator